MAMRYSIFALRGWGDPMVAKIHGHLETRIQLHYYVF
jgi:hypothetical protein